MRVEAGRRISPDDQRQMGMRFAEEASELVLNLSYNKVPQTDATRSQRA
jgi:hypothetical protein